MCWAQASDQFAKAWYLPEPKMLIPKTAWKVQKMMQDSSPPEARKTKARTSPACSEIMVRKKTK